MKIHAVQTGVVHVKADFLRGSVAAGGTLPFMRRVFTDKQIVDLPIFAWVIDHEEGIIVVDTGDVAANTFSFIVQARFTIKPEEQIGAQLHRLGIPISRVSKVIITHMHTDHVNGVVDFPDVPIYLGEKEYTQHRSLFGGMFNRLTNRLPRWFDPKPLRFENDASIPFGKSAMLTKTGDVIAIPTPGHTAGHISVIARTADVHYLMAGDITYDERGLREQALQGPSLAPDEHRQTLAHTLIYTQTHPTVYLPAHDWEAGKRLETDQIVPMPPANAVS